MSEKNGKKAYERALKAETTKIKNDIIGKKLMSEL
jgi:hypothetical protein